MWEKTFGWEFQKEPLWRWFVFIVVIGMFLNVWKSCLDHMKD